MTVGTKQPLTAIADDKLNDGSGDDIGNNFGDAIFANLGVGADIAARGVNTTGGGNPDTSKYSNYHQYHLANSTAANPAVGHGTAVMTFWRSNSTTGGAVEGEANIEFNANTVTKGSITFEGDLIVGTGTGGKFKVAGGGSGDTTITGKLDVLGNPTGFDNTPVDSNRISGRQTDITGNHHIKLQSVGTAQTTGGPLSGGNIELTGASVVTITGADIDMTGTTFDVAAGDALKLTGDSTIIITGADIDMTGTTFDVAAGTSVKLTGDSTVIITGADIDMTGTTFDVAAGDALKLTGDSTVIITGADIDMTGVSFDVTAVTGSFTIPYTNISSIGVNGDEGINITGNTDITGTLGVRSHLTVGNNGGGGKLISNNNVEANANVDISGNLEIFTGAAFGVTQETALTVGKFTEFSTDSTLRKHAFMDSLLYGKLTVHDNTIITGDFHNHWTSGDATSNFTVGPSGSPYFTIANGGDVEVKENATFKKNVVVTESLTVLGTQTIIDTSHLAVTDREIVLGTYYNDAQPGAAADRNVTLTSLVDSGNTLTPVDYSLCFGMHTDITSGGTYTQTSLGGCIKYTTDEGWNFYQPAGYVGGGGDFIGGEGQYDESGDPVSTTGTNLINKSNTITMSGPLVCKAGNNADRTADKSDVRRAQLTCDDQITLVGKRDNDGDITHGVELVYRRALAIDDYDETNTQMVAARPAHVILRDSITHTKIFATFYET